MHTKREMKAVRRLQQLVEGLSTELAQVALVCELLTNEERLGYSQAVEERVHAAKAALVPVQSAMTRLTRSEAGSS